MEICLPAWLLAMMLTAYLPLWRAVDSVQNPFEGPSQDCDDDSDGK